MERVLNPKILKNWCLEKDDQQSDLLHDPGGVIFVMWNHYIEVKKKTVPKTARKNNSGRLLDPGIEHEPRRFFDAF